MIYQNQDEVRLLYHSSPRLHSELLYPPAFTGSPDIGRARAKEGHPLRGEARGGLHHHQALEHVAQAGARREGARRVAQAAPARLRRPLP